MDGYENIKSMSRDEMRDFLHMLCATETSKCKLLCNCTFCYNEPSKRKCREKIEEYLNRTL